MAFQAAVEVQREIQARLDEADRLRLQQVTRAQYEVDLARRRYMRVDPDNRLVADELESIWHEKLRVLDQARKDFEQQRRADREILDDDGQRRIARLANDFPALWRDPATPDRERKRMLALLVEDVTLVKGDPTKIHVRFKGGRCETTTAPRALHVWEAAETPPETIAEIDRLLDDLAYKQIAGHLNERGFRSGHGGPFTGRSVRLLVHAYKLRSRFDRLRARGMMTCAEVMAKFGVASSTVRGWANRGHITGYQFDNRGYLYVIPDEWTPSRSTPGGAV